MWALKAWIVKSKGVSSKDAEQALNMKAGQWEDIEE
jgi:hypothetical protein